MDLLGEGRPAAGGPLFIRVLRAGGGETPGLLLCEGIGRDAQILLEDDSVFSCQLLERCHGQDA